MDASAFLMSCATIVLRHFSPYFCSLVANSANHSRKGPFRCKLVQRMVFLELLCCLTLIRYFSEIINFYFLFFIKRINLSLFCYPSKILIHMILVCLFNRPLNLFFIVLPFCGRWRLQFPSTFTLNNQKMHYLFM